MNLIKIVAGSIACAGSIGLATAIASHALSQPEVFVSWTTKQCVFVRDADGNEYQCGQYASLMGVSQQDNGVPAEVRFSFNYVE